MRVFTALGAIAFLLPLTGCVDVTEKGASSEDCASTAVQTIPNLVGLSSSQAESALKKICSKPKVISLDRYGFVEGASISGNVSAQYPPAGSLTDDVGCILIQGSLTDSNNKMAVEVGYFRSDESINVAMCDNNVAKITDLIFVRDIGIAGASTPSEIPDFPSTWEFNMADAKFPSSMMVLRMESSIINYSMPSYFCLKIDVNQGGWFSWDVGLDVWHGCTQQQVAKGERVGPIFIWMVNTCPVGGEETCGDFFQGLADGSWDIETNMYRADFGWAEDLILGWHERPCSELWDKNPLIYC